MITGLIPSESPEVMKSNNGMGLPLSNLLQVFQQARLPPLAVASRPTDELLLPLPLPHSFGRMLENFIEVLMHFLVTNSILSLANFSRVCQFICVLNMSDPGRVSRLAVAYDFFLNDLSFHLLLFSIFMFIFYIKINRLIVTILELLLQAPHSRLIMEVVF